MRFGVTVHVILFVGSGAYKSLSRLVRCSSSVSCISLWLLPVVTVTATAACCYMLGPTYSPVQTNRHSIHACKVVSCMQRVESLTSFTMYDIQEAGQSRR